MGAAQRRQVALPKGSWDSHVHVIDESKYPFASNASYLAPSATIQDLIAFEQKHGIENVCLVSVSIYGHDNRSIVDALQKLRGRGRAVISFDPESITDQELDELHAIGARGVRINLKTRDERPTANSLISILECYADRCRARGWLIQVYVALEQIPLIAEKISTLGVRVVVDHMASPDPDVLVQKQKGYKTLMQLLRQKQIWIKISGIYRFNCVPGIDEFGKELISTAPDNVLWASDWPHTGGPEMLQDGRMIRQYRKVDDDEFIQRCFQWCEFDDDKIERLFVKNPQRLWMGE